MSIFGTAIGAVTGPYRLYVELAVAGALVAAWGVQTVDLSSTEADLAKEKTVFSAYQLKSETAARDAEERIRVIEKDTAERLGRISDAADKRIAAANDAASSAAASALSLRDRAAATVAAGRRGCSVSAAAAARGKTAGDPIGVLADVLGRADEAAGFMAATADVRGIRGVACEAAYEALRNQAADAARTR